MDPIALEAALKRLDPGGMEWITYTCILSEEEESVLLIGDDLAVQVARSVSEINDITGAKILAGLYSAELCECDVATLTGVSEHEVVAQLQKFTALGMVAHRKVQGMNYYRLVSDIARRSIKDAMDALC